MPTLNSPLESPIGSPLQIKIEDASKLRERYQWGQIQNGYKIYACHEAQLDILRNKTKVTAAFAGTGGGKTCLVPLWLFKQYTKYKQANPDGKWRAMVVSPNDKIFADSELKDHILRVFDNTAAHGVFNDQKKKYTLPDGSTITIKTADNDYKRLSGGQYHAVVLDEAHMMSDVRIWDEAYNRTNTYDAPILLVTTPNIDGWLKERIFDRWEAGDKTYYVRQWNTAANPIKTPEEHKQFIDKIEELKGKAYVDRMYGGLFTQLSGLVYECFGGETHPRWPVIPALTRLPSPAVCSFAMNDWGWTDPAAILFAVHCEDDFIYIVEELYGDHITLDQLGVAMQGMQAKWSTDYASPYAHLIKGGSFEGFYADVNRPEWKNQLASKYGLSIKDRKIAMIDAGIARTDQVLRAGKIKVFDSCVNFIREAKSYTYKDNKPRETNNHAMDAFRYGMSSYFYSRSIDPVSNKFITLEAKAQQQIEVAIRLGLAASKGELEAKKRKEDEEKHHAYRASLMWVDDPI